MHFYTIVAKNLLRRPARSVLTVIGIAIGIAAVVSLSRWTTIAIGGRWIGFP